MTIEEAIECLIDAKEEFAYFPNHCVAFDMAIEALRRPEIVRCEDCKEAYSKFISYGSGNIREGKSKNQSPI